MVNRNYKILKQEPAHNHNFYTRKADNLLVNNMDKVNEVVQKLKATDEWKDYDENIILEHVITSMRSNAIKLFKSHSEVLAYDPNDPRDAHWKAYSPEEILFMKSQGVTVPDDVLAWAQTQINFDDSAYEPALEATSDLSTISNLNNRVDDQSYSHKKEALQKYSQRAQTQEGLAEDKAEELKDKINDLNVEKDNLEKSQKNSINKIQNYSHEFNALEEKLKNGETLSTNELSRYNQLGSLLNAESKNIIVDSKNIDDELDTLTRDINEIDNISQINENLTQNLNLYSSKYISNEKLSLRYIDKKDMLNVNLSNIISSAASARLSNDSALYSINLNDLNLQMQESLLQFQNITTETQNTSEKMQEFASAVLQQSQFNNADKNISEQNNEHNADDIKEDDTIAMNNGNSEANEVVSDNADNNENTISENENSDAANNLDNEDKVVTQENSEIDIQVSNNPSETVLVVQETENSDNNIGVTRSIASYVAPVQDEDDREQNISDVTNILPDEPVTENNSPEISDENLDIVNNIENRTELGDVTEPNVLEEPEAQEELEDPEDVITEKMPTDDSNEVKDIEANTNVANNADADAVSDVTRISNEANTHLNEMQEKDNKIEEISVNNQNSKSDLTSLLQEADHIMINKDNIESSRLNTSERMEDLYNRAKLMSDSIEENKNSVNNFDSTSEQDNSQMVSVTNQETDENRVQRSDISSQTENENDLALRITDTENNSDVSQGLFIEVNNNVKSTRDRFTGAENSISKKLTEVETLNTDSNSAQRTTENSVQTGKIKSDMAEDELNSIINVTKEDDNSDYVADEPNNNAIPTIADETRDIQEYADKDISISDHDIDLEDDNSPSNNTKELEIVAQKAVAENITDERENVYLNPLIHDTELETQEDMSEAADEELKEFARQDAMQESTRNAVKDDVAEVMQSTLSSVSVRAQKKDTDNDKKHKLFSEFENKKRSELRKTVQRVNKARDVR